MQRKSDVITGKLLVVYYSATALFMLLDYVFEINVRLAFLDLYPGWRLAYYLFCFLCLGLILWRPAWAAFIGAAESILTVSLLIISAAMRVIIVTDEMIDTGRGAVSYNEMINFAIAFSVVYVSYTRSIKALQGR